MILTLQRRLREIGRIRLGHRVRARNNKLVPAKLESFRFSSHDAEVLDAIASLYGGTVERWEDAPVGDQWQVFTEARRIPVITPPGDQVLDQWFEHWVGGGLVRRCDGANIVKPPDMGACSCDPAKRECKPTTRVSVILTEVPGLGKWRLESHGYHAAAELAGSVELLSAATDAGYLLPAILRLEQRQAKVPGEPVHYFGVPCLDVMVTVPELQGMVGIGANGAIAGRSAILDAPRGLSGAPEPVDASASIADNPLLNPEARPESVFQPQLDPSARPSPRERSGPPLVPDARHSAIPGDPGGQSGVSEPAQEPVSEPSAPSPPPGAPAPGPAGALMGDAQRRALMAVAKRIGLDDRGDRLVITTAIIGRRIPTAAELTVGEASRVLDMLTAVEEGRAEFVIDAEGRPVRIQWIDEEPRGEEPF